MSTDLKSSQGKDDDERKKKEDEIDKPETTSRGVKPIVLSAQRFKKIVNNATTNDRSKALAEAEEKQKRKEELKEGNEKLVAKFKGNMQRTQEQKLQQIKEQQDKKIKQAIANYEHAKENEALKRQEKIAKAEQIMARLKPGPRELHSAVLQSEVLRARNVQRTINEEFAKAVKKQEDVTKQMCSDQASKWIGDDEKRLNQRQMSTNAYKKELLQTINENQKQRQEQKTQLIKEQQAAREATDMEIKAQIEKEKALMEKKKEALRKNALEAMKMVEQRRLRDRVVERLNDRLCCVYNTGKKQLEELLMEQSKKLTDEEERNKDAEVKVLNNLDEKKNALESERIRRDITTMQLKFTAEEQEKVRKDKAAKQARIEAYLKERQRQKEMQDAIEEKKRFEVAQRLKNEEVNYIFAEKRKEQKLERFQKVRSELDKQIEDNRRHQILQKQAAVSCAEPGMDKEHNFFFEYACTLMKDAQEKGRPLYPFVKAVQQYKRENQFECDRKTAKHLQSNVPIGEKTSKTLAGEKNEKDEQNSIKGNILENCLKIDEIFAANITQNEKVKKENTANGDILKQDCASNQLRYSMDELKKMNQFSAPTCH